MNDKSKIATLKTVKKRIEILPTNEVSVLKQTSSEIEPMERKKILFVASEARPFIATGGLADVMGSFSLAADGGGFSKTDGYLC